MPVARFSTRRPSSTSQTASFTRRAPARLTSMKSEGGWTAPWITRTTDGAAASRSTIHGA
jgi:hypothetical protein